jgi:hypothetical protein
METEHVHKTKKQDKKRTHHFYKFYDSSTKAISNPGSKWPGQNWIFWFIWGNICTVKPVFNGV